MINEECVNNKYSLWHWSCYCFGILHCVQNKMALLSVTTGSSAVDYTPRGLRGDIKVMLAPTHVSKDNDSSCCDNLRTYSCEWDCFEESIITWDWRLFIITLRKVPPRVLFQNLHLNILLLIINYRAYSYDI